MSLPHLYLNRWMGLLLALGLPALGAPDNHGPDCAHAHQEEEKTAAETDGLGPHRPDEHEEGLAHRDHDGHDHGGDTRKLDIPDEVLGEFGIEVAAARPGTLRREVLLPGEIRFNRDRMARVAPRFAGTLREVRVGLADAVKKDQVLAVLESTETLRPFELRAPFDGVVVESDLALGETVEAGTPLMAVADLSSVWADLRIYQRDLAAVRPGMRVRIEAGHDLPPCEGLIAYIAPTLDEPTRTGLARVELDNAAGDWKPGMFVKARVDAGALDADLVVPRGALIELDGEHVVFVRTDHGFEPRPVRTGQADADCVEILHGLRQHERIAVRNVISLKAEWGKATFGGHEGHAH